MKKKIVLISSVFFFALLLVGVNSCKDDDVDFILETLVSGTIDMNAATPPNNVPADATFEATFSVDVDAATVTAATVSLDRDYDAANIPLTFAVAGKKVTITPGEGLGNGALYVLSFKAGIKSTDGQDLPPLTRAFTTEGNFVPSGVVAYWNFNDNLMEQIQGVSPIGVVDLTYEDSYKAAAGKAGKFNGTSTIVEYANGDQLMNTSDFTLSFWVKTKSAGHVNENGDPKGHFVMGLGAFKGFQFEIPGDYSSCKLAASYELADGSTAPEDLWFAGDGNLGWQGWTFCKDLSGSGGVAAQLKDEWAHVTCTYNSATREGVLYINGEKMKAQDFDLWPDDDVKRGVKGLKYGGVAPEVVNELAFGFIQSRAGTLWDNEPWGGYDFPTANHFGGWLDDIRIFHKALTATEIDLMYRSEKP
ncbi:MAG: Ig-like domain-containing protein [Bacteroidales bacterium]|nr:Ig-like domain-containing protein [Bacteroidales bacterium]